MTSYDLRNIDKQSNSDNYIRPKDNGKNTGAKPIKIIHHNNDAMGLREKAMIGHGTITCVVAIPQFSSRSLSQQCIDHVLLDSRSNGDLAFVQRCMKESILCKKNIAPQRWNMSNGTFVTDG